MKMHEPINEATLSSEKERKILDRLISHQLIILENPPSSFIDEVKL
jgi:hypothetical protein